MMARKSCKIITLEIGAGICATCIKLAGIFSKPPRMTAQMTQLPIIELSHIGIISIGFMTTGVLKTIGSLILNSDGPRQILPMVFNLALLEKHIRRFKVKVAPVPPIMMSPRL